MFLVFPTTFDYPTRFAHPLHGIAMAREFAKILGGDFLFTHGQILDPSRLEGILSQSILGVKPRLIKKLHLRRIAAFVWLAGFCARHRGERLTFYVIDRTLVFLLVLLRPFFRFTLVFEYHAFYYNWLDRLILRKTDALIFLTHALQQKAHQWAPFAKKSIVLPEGIALEPFRALETISVAALREELKLPKDKTLIGYIGRFRPMGMDKGIETLVEAARFLSQEISIYCVGGTKDEIAWYEDRAKAVGVVGHIVFLPFQEQSRIPKFARAFDILVYIPPANDFFSYYTSPMKLFEYMAAQKPIVVSDLPAFREIVSEEEVWFVKAGDAEQFAQMVTRVVSERPEMLQNKINRAYGNVAQYAWDKRAARIIALCKNL